MSCLHRFQLDDSKPLESQINQMSDMRSQLATMGDEISDAKFAIIISGALPSLYDTLKTVAIASVTDMSQLMSDTLILQILREEKCKGNQDSTAALLAKQQKTPDKSPGLKQSQKSKKGKNRPCCTNLKCKKIGHTIETVGPKVVVLRARDQSRLWEHSMDQVHKQKILQRRRMPRPMFYLCKNLLLLPNLIALIQLNGSSTL